MIYNHGRDQADVANTACDLRKAGLRKAGLRNGELRLGQSCNRPEMQEYRADVRIADSCRCLGRQSTRWNMTGRKN
jgi:hypothetical protein